MPVTSSYSWQRVAGVITICAGALFALNFCLFAFLRPIIDYEHELRSVVQLFERDARVHAEASRKHEDITLEDFDLAIWTANYPPVGLLYAERLGHPSQRIDGLVFEFESGTSTFDRKRLQALGVDGERLSDVAAVFSRILVAAFDEPLDDQVLVDPKEGPWFLGPVFSPKVGGRWIRFAPPKQTALMLHQERHMEEHGYHPRLWDRVEAAGEEWFASTWGSERFGEQGPPKGASANR